MVSAAPFRDRVVHHALIAVIASPLERQFIPTSYANRQGFGSHRALRRYARACRDHARVRQAAIRLYVPSIDHQRPQGQLERMIACPGPAIDAFPGDILLSPVSRQVPWPGAGQLHWRGTAGASSCDRQPPARSPQARLTAPGPMASLTRQAFCRR
jgi:RNA-directed DNA polymerase